MPKPDERGSLMNLKANLPKVAPIHTTEEMERRILGSSLNKEGLPVASKDVSKDVVTTRGEADLRGGPRNSRREGTILLNAKIPVSLHTRLKRTSQFNDVSMTDILVNGIESELDSGKYSVPPEMWGTDNHE
jgi:hypothetical protein